MIERIKKYIFVLVLLIILFLLTSTLYLMDFLLMKDLWVNLSAGFILLIATVFVIDVLLEKRKQAELKEALDVSEADLRELTNMLVSYPALALGFNTINFKEATNPERNIEAIAKDMVSQTIVIVLTPGNLYKSLLAMDIKQWEHLEINLISIKSSLNEKVPIYQSLLTSSVLGKLLKTRKSFNTLYFTFGLFSQIFIHKPVAGKDDLKGVFIKNLEQNFIQYYKDVANLIKLIERNK